MVELTTPIIHGGPLVGSTDNFTGHRSFMQKTCHLPRSRNAVRTGVPYHEDRCLMLRAATTGTTYRRRFGTMLEIVASVMERRPTSTPNFFVGAATAFGKAA
jgi:hypothetical protein